MTTQREALELARDALKAVLGPIFHQDDVTHAIAAIDAALEDDPPVGADDLRPCSACPDGYVWNSNGPTSRPCPVCGGTAVLHRDGSKMAKDEL